MSNLHDAIRKGDINKIKYLVSQGADIKDDNNYAIKWASKNGHLDVVKYLVSIGADINKINITNTLITKLYNNHCFELLHKLLENNDNSKYMEIKKQINKINNNLLINNIYNFYSFSDILFI